MDAGERRQIVEAGIMCDVGGLVKARFSELRFKCEVKFRSLEARGLVEVKNQIHFWENKKIGRISGLKSLLGPLRD